MEIEVSSMTGVGAATLTPVFYIFVAILLLIGFIAILLSLTAN